MSIIIEIPEPMASQLEAKARNKGTSPEMLVLEAVYQSLDPFAQIDQLMTPVRERIAELSESEDDVGDFLEDVKHEMRRNRNTL